MNKLDKTVDSLLSEELPVEGDTKIGDLLDTIFDDATEAALAEQAERDFAFAVQMGYTNYAWSLIRPAKMRELAQDGILPAIPSSVYLHDDTGQVVGRDPVKFLKWQKENPMPEAAVNALNRDQREFQNQVKTSLAGLTASQRIEALRRNILKRKWPLELIQKDGQVAFDNYRKRR